MISRRRKELVNPNPIASWKPGTECWFYDTDSDKLVNARVVDDMTSSLNGGAVLLNWFDGIFEHSRAMTTDTLFADPIEAQAAAEAYKDGLAQSFLDEMPDLASMILFAWTNLIPDDDPKLDPLAIDAFIERAKSLAGIDLPGVMA